MDNRDFDSWLRRPLRSGERFDKLLPTADYQTEVLEVGDTAYSVEEMADTVFLYCHQTEKLAPVLKKQTLGQTVLSIHDFLYHHLQYRADDENQLLRSPQRSWAERREGIDCKSYSIFASCILTNLDLVHYIRRIKQPHYEPDGFTHVYVVVPKNQKTGSLSDGYYTIDATLPTTQEPAYIEKSDVKMSGLQHYRLNAPAYPLNGGINISQISKSLNFGTAWNLIKCAGGSSLSTDGLKKYLANVDLYYQNLVNTINTAVQNNDYQTFSKAVAEFFGNSKVFASASDLNNKKGWNKCTTDAINQATTVHKLYRDTAGGCLKAYLSAFYDTTGTNGTLSFTSKDAEKKYGFRHLNLSNPVVIDEPLVMYLPKPTTSIPAFEITQYVTDQIKNKATIVATDYIATLDNVIKAFTPPAGSGSQNNQNQGNNGSYYEQDTPKPSNNQNGQPDDKGNNTVLWVVGGIAAAGIAYAVFAGMKTKNPTENAA